MSVRLTSTRSFGSAASRRRFAFSVVVASMVASSGLARAQEPAAAPAARPAAPSEPPSDSAPVAKPAPDAPAAAPAPSPPRDVFQSAGSSVVADSARMPVTYLDRTVVRYSAPETGGTLSPHFVFERELAFEARLEALADSTYTPEEDRPYGRHHLQAALERHIAETLLASLRIDPEPKAERIDAQIAAARVLLTEQVGGALALQAAAQAEGIGALELRNLLRRRARASLYLDQMVAPMLAPSEAELRKIHRTGQTPFRGQPYRDIAARLRRWYIGTRLGAAALAFYQNARARLVIEFLPRTYPER